jgi:hypothetical protein
MPSIDFRNEKLYAPRKELASDRFEKQPVSQLSLPNGKGLSQQVVGQIVQRPVARFARLPLPEKSQTLTRGLVLQGKWHDSVWRIGALTSKLHFNPVEFDGIGEFPNSDPKGYQ